MPPGLWTPPFPFSSRSNRPRRNLFYTCFIFTADLRIFPYTAAHFSPKNGSAPVQSSNEGRRPCPSIRTHIRSEAYKYRFDLLFASLLCTIVVNIFFPEDIYDGIAQTIYLPIQLIAGISLFDIRRKGYLLTLLIFLGGLLIVGRLLDSFTPLNLREYLVFAYVSVLRVGDARTLPADLHGPAGGPGKRARGAVRPAPHRVLRFFRLRRRGVPSTGARFPGSRPAGQGFRDLFYFSYVTILTIGYGDITPHTWVAKNATILVALIAYMYSLVIVAMIVNQFAENRTLKRQEKPAFPEAPRQDSKSRLLPGRAIDRMGSGRKKSALPQSEGHPYRLLLRHGGPDGHHRAWRGPHHFMGDGPEQQTVKPRPPVRAHDDEAGSLLFSQLYQLFGRPPHKNNARGIHPGELFRQEGVHGLLDGFVGIVHFIRLVVDGKIHILIRRVSRDDIGNQNGGPGHGRHHLRIFNGRGNRVFQVHRTENLLHFHR